MRNAILFIIFLIFSFLINVIFYYISDDYRYFLKNIKSDNSILTEIDNSFYKSNSSEKDNQSIEVTDDFLLDNNIEIVETNKENENVFDKLDWKKVEVKSNISLWKNYLKVLDIFSDYSFQELELNTNLFDITDEYPDNYIEYYSRDLTLYFFPTKNYTEIYDIFSVLEFELPFKLNQTNSFWDDSFFINLNQDISDNFVRTIVSYNWVVFWLKIKKNEYNIIRDKLNILRNN